MGARREYRKKSTSTVVAVRLDLETEGFTYYKWGDTQTCRAGDWVVLNGDDTYTVNGSTFEATYQMVSPGVYTKVSSVWAEVAEKPGKISTKEGVTHYEAGAYIVYNDAAGTDGYAVDRRTFEELYEPVAKP